jgi:hypothetical protein
MEAAAHTPLAWKASKSEGVMSFLSARALALTLAAADIMGATDMAQARNIPTVIELFTSQGCSSCPPANANLIELSKDPDILTLSFSVTYWDYLGWKDSFGRADYTARQVTYEPALHQPGPFTPQMVINGAFSTVGYDVSEIRSTIQQAGPLKGPSLSVSGRRITLSQSSANTGPLDLWYVTFEPKVLEVAVKRGENSGATLPHASVVRNLVHLGQWTGDAVNFALPPSDGPLRQAILLQKPNGGPIVSAETLE